MEQTNFLFLGMMIPKDRYDEVKKNTKGSMHDAANALQWHLYDGLCQNLNAAIHIINVLPVHSWPRYYRKAHISSSTFKTKYSIGNENIGYLNLRGIRKLSKSKNLYRVLSSWCEKKPGKKIIFVYTFSRTLLSVVSKIKQFYGDVEICVIIADLPDMSNLSSKKDFVSRVLAKRVAEMAYNYIDCVNYYVLLTKYMAEYMKLKKPFCIIEGISTSQDEFPEPQYDNELKTIFYGGTLHKKFGILNLVEAFKEIESPDYRLVLCGTGDCENEILAEAKLDERIIFHGKLSRKEVLRLQSEATVLVNPRQNDEEFTKYSFPSKNLEYLSSGIPFVAYKLDGIPDEYDQYILYVEDNDVSSLSRKIVEVCEKTSHERAFIGEKARSFVQKQKNEIIQTQKIINLIKNIEESESRQN